FFLEMSEPAEKNENIPDASAGKGIPNGGTSVSTVLFFNSWSVHFQDFNLATIYVSDAQYNRNIYFDTSPQAVRLYLLYNHWALKILLYFFILVNLSLAIFEEPALVSLPTWATMLVELLCLLVFTIRLVHYAKVIPREKFWKDPKNICIIVVLLVGFHVHFKTLMYLTWSKFCKEMILLSIFCYLIIKHAFYLNRICWPRIKVQAVYSPLFSFVALKQEEIRQLVRAKRHKMARAFGVLQEQREEGGPPVVSHENWNKLVQRARPDISSAHRELLWRVCDDSNQGFIGKVAFVQLADLLNIEVITLKSRPHPLQSLIPSFYESKPSRLLCRVVQHRGFVITFDLIILVNAVFIGLDEENPLISNSEWVFLALYVLEILLKLYVFEPRAFFSKHTGGYTSRQVLDIVFILRVLRLIRVVDRIKRFRAIINTLIRIGPAILTFGQLILVSSKSSLPKPSIILPNDQIKIIHPFIPHPFTNLLCGMVLASEVAIKILNLDFANCLFFGSADLWKYFKLRPQIKPK
uniref:Uncharacterized protein n=1 Tax=Xiphophorus couchianus TaxID=32473 RepID=A0A3B5LVZ1_9TELE